jgi:hypothetical protein
MGIPKVSPFLTRRGLFISRDPHYSVVMNTLAKLPANAMSQRGLTLLLTADQARTGISEFIAALVLSGPLFVVAASEWLPAYKLTRIVRRNTVHVRQTLDRLHTVRSSTCYRLLDSLINTPPQGEPILVLDFLHTFYDPDIPLRVRFFKLRECCRHLKGLAMYRPVIVMTQEMQVDEYGMFLPVLQSMADRILSIEPELEKITQPALL